MRSLAQPYQTDGGDRVSGVSTTSFKSIKTPRASLGVVRQIQDAIFRGDFRPGDKLPPERELIAQFGVSRVTVRESARILETYGVVEIRPGARGGVFIRNGDARSVGEAAYNMLRLGPFRLHELYDCRLCFEPSVAAMASRYAQDQDIADLDQSIGRASLLVRNGKRTSEESLYFHRAVLRASKNRVNVIVLGSLLDVIRLANASLPSSPEIDQMVLEDHVAIVEAIRARDGPLASTLMKSHVRRVSSEFRRVYERPQTDHSIREGTVSNGLEEEQPEEAVEAWLEISADKDA